MLQSNTECYRVFLAHLLGRIFGLVLVLLYTWMFLWLLCLSLSVWLQVGPSCVQFPRSPPAAAAGYKSAEASDLQTRFEWKVISSIQQRGSVPGILFSWELRLIGAHVHYAPGGERGVGKFCSWWQSAAEGMQKEISKFLKKYRVSFTRSEMAQLLVLMIADWSACAVHIVQCTLHQEMGEEEENGV